MLKTPFGNVKVLVDGKDAEYILQEVLIDLPVINTNPLDGSYRIVVPINKNKSVSCTIENKEQIESTIETGEGFVSLEFSKNNILLSLGAEEESNLLETLNVANGFEYKIKNDIKCVKFGVAWTLNAEPMEVRTWYACDPTFNTEKYKHID